MITRSEIRKRNECGKKANCEVNIRAPVGKDVALGSLLEPRAVASGRWPREVMD